MASKGFTLIEMIITLAIAAILITAVVPGFQEFIKNNRLATQANAFVTALQMARAEAIKRDLAVTLCKSADGKSCSDNNDGFEQGWIIFTDSQNRGQVDTSETVININQGVWRYKDETTGNYIYSLTLKCISTENGGALCQNGEKKITYRSDGSTSAANMTLRLCQKGRKVGRLIYINITGRTRVDLAEYKNCPT